MLGRSFLSNKMKNKNIKKLENLIKHHKALYYQGRPEITDTEYDKIEDKLRLLESDNPALKIIGSIAKKSSSNKVKHETKMLSLAKTYRPEELIKWMANEKIISTRKIDGISCSLIYQDNKLILAKTRGDGSLGEDITQKVHWMKTIPSSISLSGKVEIRGELFIREKEFFQLSEEMLTIGLESPTSQRNIVAGLISRKENIELSRYIEFMAFDLIEKKIQNSEIDKFRKLIKEQYRIPEYELISNEKELLENIQSTGAFMSDGDYQIDGVVFTYNDTQLHEELGSTSHHPRYKMAFKFEGTTKNTFIEDIAWSVSRNGILTPVAAVKAVELSGAMITRVTLHNYAMVKHNDLKIGDEIEIIRSGEVIPKFLSVIRPSKNKLLIPITCPSCDEKVMIEEIRIFCRNKNCPDQIKESILNFVKKIGIDNLSSKRLEEMMRVGLVKNIVDLYKLKKKDFLTLDKVKDKLADKFVETIDNSKNADITTFLSALGITGGAYNKCDKVVQAGFDTIPRLKKITIEGLMEVDSFAEKSATDFINSFTEKVYMVDKLLKLGFEFKEKNISKSRISGKKICITGSLKEKRSIIELKIRAAGASTVGSVSKNTDYLLTNDGDSRSSKAQKAKQLGISIISEADLALLI
jgi:DNA ligase (NAD+)